MTALYIILGIIALIFLLLLCKITVRVSYCRDIEVTVRYLFLKFDVFKGTPGGKDKHIAAPSEEEKKEKKKRKKKEKKEKEEPELVRPPLGELVPAVLDVLKKVLKKLGRSARLEKAKFHCLVASDDPAKTAMLYGAVSGVAGNIFVLLKSLKHRSKKKGAIDFKVEPDFIADKFDLDADIKISAVPLMLIVTAITAAVGYVRIKGMWKESKSA